MGSGKDYIACKYIVPYLSKVYGLNCLRLSFADQIKVNVMTKKNVPFEELHTKNKYTRTLLQQEGTEHGRDIIGKDVWIKYYDAWVKTFTSKGVDVIITSDVRFLNELDYIKSQNGLLVKVVAPQRNQQRLVTEANGEDHVYKTISQHSSECDLDQVDDDLFDVVLNNDVNVDINKDELYRKLDGMFRRELRC